MEEGADRRRASLRVVFGIVTLDLIGFGILIPQLGVYGVKFGASPFTVGLLLSVYSLMQLIFAPVLGRLSDRYGRRPVLLLSLTGSMASYLLFAFAHSLPLLFLARIIDGVSGGNIATAQAYVADVTRPEERAQGMGVIGAAFGLGFVLGPVLGGFLGAWGGNRAIGLFAAGLAALNLALTFTFLAESRHPGSPATASGHRVSGALSSLRLPVVGLCLVLMLVFNTAFSQMEGTFSVYLLSRFLSSGPVPLEGGMLFLSARASAEQLSQASLRTGGLFAVVGVVSAVMQGGVPHCCRPAAAPSPGTSPSARGGCRGGLRGDGAGAGPAAAGPQLRLALPRHGAARGGLRVHHALPFLPGLSPCPGRPARGCVGELSSVRLAGEDRRARPGRLALHRLRARGAVWHGGGDDGGRSPPGPEPGGPRANAGRERRSKLVR